MSALQLFHPAVQRWFGEKLGTPTDVQSSAWPRIATGEHVLVTAPTGCGKTLAAFLWALDRLLGGHWPSDGLSVLYISPLKALNNDVQRNLMRPLLELEPYFLEQGTLFPKIEVMTRSGDSTERERRKLRRSPPSILITTPESLNILLTQKSAPLLFGNLKTVIVDEIHAIAPSKRGTSLATALERLVSFAGEFQRIGLSATVNPPSLVAQFLAGFRRTNPDSEEDHFEPRPISTVTSLSSKAYDVRVLLPELRPDPDDADHVYWESLALELKKLVRSHTSTLIFTNSRRACERLTRLMNENEEPLLAYSHHGSLSKDIRLDVEEKLKAGELKAIVATNSLELGIDIGDLEEVVLAQAPHSVSSAIQKTGRAGHKTSAVSKARLYPSDGIDSVEAAVLTRSILEQNVEEISIPEGPLDVLAQVVLSSLCCESLSERELYLRTKAAWPYRNLSEVGFSLVVEMLAGRYAGTRIKELKPRITFEPVRQVWSAGDEVPFLLYSSGGTIPDRGYFGLRDKRTGAKIGELDEEFVWERRLGDSFALGAQLWKIVQVTDTDVLVENVDGRAHLIPFWKGEDLDRSFHLAEKIALFLQRAERLMESDEIHRTSHFVTELVERHCFSTEAAERLENFLGREKRALDVLPHRYRVVAETVLVSQKSQRTLDVHQIILHTFWGARVNRPWAFALSQAWEDRFGYALETYAGNDQILLLVPPETSISELFELVPIDDLETLLRKRLESTGFFGARFRESAGRALLLPKGAFGSRQPLWQTRLRAKKLLDAVLRFEDFPILLEAWRQCLYDEFELETLKQLLEEIKSGIVEVVEKTTQEPSPFTEGILWRQVNQHMYEGDAPNAEKHSRLSDEVWKEVLANEKNRPKLTRDFVSTWESQLQQTSPLYAPQSALELLDLLELRVCIPMREWINLLDGTCRNLEISRAEFEAQISSSVVLLPGKITRVCHPLVQEDLDHPFDVMLSWLDYYGPISIQRVAEFWNLDADSVTEWAGKQAQSDALLIGRFLDISEDLEICRPDNWEHLVRKNRLARREAIHPRPVTDLSLFLATHQGLTQTAYSQEKFQSVMEQLFGLSISAELWESVVFPSRLSPYFPAALDSLFQNSNLRWFGTDTQKIAFAFEDEIGVFVEHSPENSEASPLVALFGANVQATVTELTNSSGRSTKDVQTQLWESAWKTQVTTPNFEPLRKAIVSGFDQTLKTQNPIPIRRGVQRWESSVPQTVPWERVNLSTAHEKSSVERLENLKTRARQILDRYGIVFRELLANELPTLHWRELFPAFKVMELSGEIVGGMFFEGIGGLQFASAEVCARWNEELDESALYVQTAVDPSSLCGLKIEAYRSLPRRQAGNWIWWKGSTPVATLTANAKKLQLLTELTAQEWSIFVERTAQLLFLPAHEPRHHWTIETIDDLEAPSHPAAQILTRLGFHDHSNRLVLWKQTRPSRDFPQRS